nr:hypothetical protein DM860_007633 [Ipomoea batatas]
MGRIFPSDYYHHHHYTAFPLLSVSLFVLSIATTLSIVTALCGFLSRKEEEVVVLERGRGGGGGGGQRGAERRRGDEPAAAAAAGDAVGVVPLPVELAGIVAAGVTGGAQEAGGEHEHEGGGAGDAPHVEEGRRLRRRRGHGGQEARQEAKTRGFRVEEDDHFRGEM